MKFEYTGEDNHRSLELVAYKIMTPKELLMKGDVIDVPDKEKVVIDALNASGVFKKANNKNIKKEEKKEEDK